MADASQLHSPSKWPSTQSTSFATNALGKSRTVCDFEPEVGAVGCFASGVGDTDPAADAGAGAETGPCLPAAVNCVCSTRCEAVATMSRDSGNRGKSGGG